MSSTSRHHLNAAVLCGTITDEPTLRSLPAGTSVAQFDVAIRRTDDAVVESVPVAWYEPSPGELAPLAAGLEVVVVGRVRRRFFRSGGATQSRTEVVADRCVPARRAKTVRSLLAAVADALS